MANPRASKVFNWRGKALNSRAKMAGSLLLADRYRTKVLNWWGKMLNWRTKPPAG